MNAVKYIWLNGKMVKWKDAKIHFLTHALHYGTGGFEGIRCYNTVKGPTIFRFKDHLNRLFNSAHILLMKLPYSKRQLWDATMKLVKVNKLKECYIRPLFYLGYGSMGLNPLNVPVELGIAVWPWGPYLGEEGIKKGVRTKISSYSRFYPASMMTKAKCSGGYINSALSKAEAILGGYDEGIMLDTDGFIGECSGENIFMVREGALITPPTETILEGITRKSVIQIAKDIGLEVREERFTRDQLYTAEEAFMTGTAAEVTPIREVDDRVIGSGKPGPMTKMLQKKFYDIIHGREEQYLDWLDYVK